MKRIFKRGDKVFSLTLRRAAIVKGKTITEYDDSRQYEVEGIDEFGNGHLSEEFVYDLVPMDGRDGKRNRALVKQLEQIVKLLAN